MDTVVVMTWVGRFVFLFKWWLARTKPVSGGWNCFFCFLTWTCPPSPFSLPAPRFLIFLLTSFLVLFFFLSRPPRQLPFFFFCLVLHLFLFFFFCFTFFIPSPTSFWFSLFLTCYCCWGFVNFTSFLLEGPYLMAPSNDCLYPRFLSKILPKNLSFKKSFPFFLKHWIICVMRFYSGAIRYPTEKTNKKK